MLGIQLALRLDLVFVSVRLSVTVRPGDTANSDPTVRL